MNSFRPKIIDFIKYKGFNLTDSNNDHQVWVKDFTYPSTQLNKQTSHFQLHKDTPPSITFVISNTEDLCLLWVYSRFYIKLRTINEVHQEVNKEIKRIDLINKLKEIEYKKLNKELNKTITKNLTKNLRVSLPHSIESSINWKDNTNKSFHLQEEISPPSILYYSLSYKNSNGWQITKDYKTLEELVNDKDSFINEIKDKENNPPTKLWVVCPKKKEEEDRGIDNGRNSEETQSEENYEDIFYNFKLGEKALFLTEESANKYAKELIELNYDYEIKVLWARN